MSDQATGNAPLRPALVASLAGGAISGLLYSSILLTAAFLVPVQIVFGRSGRGAGSAAAGVSAGVIAIAQALRMAQAGVLEPAALLMGMVPSAVLLLALVAMNAGFWKGQAERFRTIAPAAACSLAAIPLLVSVAGDRSIAGFLEGWIKTFLASVAGEGVDASALTVAVDPSQLADEIMTGLYNSYAASLFALLGGSWLIGNRLAGIGSAGRALVGPIERYRLPYGAVWPFLAAWTAVLAAVALRAPAVPTAIAWNLALTAAMAYAAQGIGVATHLLKAWGAPRGLRIALAVTAVLALLAPATGIVVAVAVPVLGVTETWIPYRKQKESEHESNT
jgi:hypothetical protein